MIGNRVIETTTTQGTGTLNLAGAVAGAQAFADAFATGTAQIPCWMLQTDGADGWEAFLATFTAGSPDTLSRDTVLASSNAGAAVNWGAGTKTVFVAPNAATWSALTDFLSKSVAGGVDVTLTAVEARHAYYKFTGALTASINVVVPPIERLFVAENPTSGAFTLTVKTASGTGVAVAQGATGLLYCDGTNVVRAGGNVLTTRGDVVRGGLAGVPERVNIAAAGKALVGDGTDAVATGVVKQGKHTIAVPAAAMYARTTGGAASGSVETATNKVMVKTFDFDAAADEFVQLQVPMPKSWDEGTITAEFLWSHPATATNFDVVWGIQGLAVGNDDALDGAFGTAVTVTDTGGTTDDLYLSAATAAVTLAGAPAAGDMAIFQVFRDADNAADTLAVDARLHGVRIAITIDAADDA